MVRFWLQTLEADVDRGAPKHNVAHQNQSINQAQLAAYMKCFYSGNPYEKLGTRI